MTNQEKFIIIDTKEKKVIIKLLKEYYTILEKAYKQTKKKKPFQNIIIANLVEAMNDITKTIKRLEEKGSSKL